MTELEKLVEKDAIRDQYYVYARALDRIDNPLDDFAGEIGRGPELAAVAFRNDLSGGTAHIDVDNFSAIGYINCCSLGHF